jgi:hypothetical protein
MGAEPAPAMAGKKKQANPNAVKWAQVSLRVVQVRTVGGLTARGRAPPRPAAASARRERTIRTQAPIRAPPQAVFMAMMLGGAVHVVAVGGAPSP